MITGWFSEFGVLEGGADGGPDTASGGAMDAASGGPAAAGAAGRRVIYGAGPDRFAGSTYDPTSHYRAAEVFDFFEERGLTPALLRQVSRHQVGRLAAGFDALSLDPSLIRRPDVDLIEVGGFLALRSPRAAEFQRGLRRRGVRTDHRDGLLRLGPAPYLSDEQLDAAIDALAETAAELAG